MTRKTFEALRDCTVRIKDITPSDEKRKEMYAFFSMIERLAEICRWEGQNGLKNEAAGLPEDKAYEKTFKESVCMWVDGAEVDEATDHAADRYFEDKPDGFDAAIYFAAVYSVRNILRGELAYGFIDQALRYLLPDDTKWREENPFDHYDETRRRFDDVRICDLIPHKDPSYTEIGRRIADKLPKYRDGALQLILKELTYTEFENALYALPREAEDRIISNVDPMYVAEIKGDCILNKDSVSPEDIRTAAAKLEEAIDAYTGDPDLDSEYD